jgi:hypothetical protein
MGGDVRSPSSRDRVAAAHQRSLQTPRTVNDVTRLLAIRGEEPPADTVLIIRAGVMSLETLRRTASDSFDDYGAYLISVEAVLGDSTIADTCRRSPRIGQRYGKVRISTAGRLVPPASRCWRLSQARTSTWSCPTCRTRPWCG